MTKIVIIACMFFMGCMPPPYVATYDQIHYFGDSNCELFNPWTINAAEYLGINHDCRIDRSVYDYDAQFLPEGDLVIFALGINAPRSREEFKARVEFLFGTTSAPILCVLPVSLDSRADMPREVLIEVCNNYVDPLDAPVTIQEYYNGEYDGVHYTDPESQELLAFLIQPKMIEILGSDYFD